MQTSARISTLLLFLLPHLLLLAPAAQAHRAVKSGCLNYGHSCLGAHGKRGSWPASAPLSPAARLAPFLPALAAPRPHALSWTDKLAIQQQNQQQQQQYRRHTEEELDQEQEQEQEQEQKLQKPQQHRHNPSSPALAALFDDSALLPRVSLALPLARPLSLKPDGPAAQDNEEIVLSYPAYDYDYGERRAKRSVDERMGGKAYPTRLTVSCLLFSRRC